VIFCVSQIIQNKNHPRNTRMVFSFVAHRNYLTRLMYNEFALAQNNRVVLAHTVRRRILPLQGDALVITKCDDAYSRNAIKCYEI
jgi:hypothetical protein